MNTNTVCDKSDRVAVSGDVIHTEDVTATSLTLRCGEDRIRIVRDGAPDWGGLHWWRLYQAGFDGDVGCVPSRAEAKQLATDLLNDLR
jgi:hypothetical protein